MHSLIRRHCYRCFLLCLLLATTPYWIRAQSQNNSPKTQLRVALFPYIPDILGDNFQAMLLRIEQEFEVKNPTIDLVLKPLNKKDDFYDSETLTKWLTTAPADGGYDMVEVDTVVLGELSAANLVSPWGTPPGVSDWHPAGRSGVSINGTVYGVPHWLCGHFIFSRDKRVAKAKTAAKLLAALDKADPKVPNLAGNLLGSWNMPALYLDAWADTHGTGDVGSAITPLLDPKVMRWFKQFSKQCETGGKNPCIDGEFDDDENEKAPQQFALGKADAFLGYSERLSYMLRQGADAKKIRISSAPLGEGKHPVLFVDAFVLRRSCDAACQQVASRFAAYMNASTTQEWILMGRDKGTDTIPRYLIPATISAFRAPAVKRDSHFKMLKAEIKGGMPYPASGLPAARKKMRDAILAELKQ
jgi:thiamine pyridinylase